MRYRTILLGLPLALALIGYAITKVTGPRYSAESRFVAQGGEDNRSQLMSLSAQFGITLPGMTNEGESMEFYTELLRSRGILRQVVQDTFPIYESGRAVGRASLIQQYGISQKRPPRERIQLAMERLSRDIRVHSGIKSGVVTLTTTATQPELAVDLNRKLLDMVSRFNLETRQSRAGAERQFVAARVTEAEHELRQAEAALTDFYKRNRSWEGSAELRNQVGQLERRVALRQEVYTVLAQRFEEARIREIRNTPVITTVHDAGDWVARTSRPAAVNGILWGMFGGVIALLIALTLDRLNTERKMNPDVWTEFRRRLTFRRAS